MAVLAGIASPSVCQTCPMAQDRDKDAPSLEPPSLFGRKKKRTPRPAPVEPVEPVEPAPETAVEPTVEPAVEPAVEAAAPPAAEPVVPTLEPPSDDSPTTILDDVSEPTPGPAPEPVPASAGAPTAPQERPPRPPRQPWLLGRPAAAMTGLLVGALIVAATAGSLRICTAAKGTSSCGGPGFFLLLAILLVAVLVGAALLKAAAVPQPGSTSFLAVGLLSVVALLFLVGSIFEWWMIIVVPIVSVATFLLSHWVTTTYIEPEDDASDPGRQSEAHDVR
jgi:hypothetical protein